MKTDKEYILCAAIWYKDLTPPSRIIIYVICMMRDFMIQNIWAKAMRDGKIK